MHILEPFCLHAKSSLDSDSIGTRSILVAHSVPVMETLPGGSKEESADCPEAQIANLGSLTRSHPNNGVFTRFCLPEPAISFNVFMSSSSSLITFKLSAIPAGRDRLRCQPILPALLVGRGFQLTLSGDRLGKNDDPPVDLITDTDRSRADPVFFTDLDQLFILEQRRSRRPEGAVSLQQDSLVVAKLFQVVLRVVGVKLDLVDGGYDFPRLGQVFQVGDGPI